ncbi:MAG: TetR/AcrR family transcriptional regulator [Acidimicrobiales bacterium]
MPRVEGIRARNRAAIEAELMAVAGRHLAEHGAAALSLRAVARDLGMASSALYRYVPNRDELLTRLIVAAYDDLADRGTSAVAALDDPGDTVAVFTAIAHSVRSWALAHPHEYALIYGSPVPGYDAPAERTTPAGTRLTSLLISAAGGLRPRSTDPGQAELDTAALGPLVTETGPGANASTLRRGITAWTLVIGTISAEIFGQYGSEMIADSEAMFASAVAAAVHLLIGPSAP